MKSRNKQCVGAFAVIFNDKNEILLGQRNEGNKKHSFHEKWGLPGGTVHFGEHPEETVIREVREEVGVVIELVSNYPIVYSHATPHVQDFLLFYPAKYRNGQISTEQDPDTLNANWFSFDKIDFANCIPETKETILRAGSIIKHL